nr:EOG090X081X [Artemia franciscana]
MRTNTTFKWCKRVSAVMIDTDVICLVCFNKCFVDGDYSSNIPCFFFFWQIFSEVFSMLILFVILSIYINREIVISRNRYFIGMIILVEIGYVARVETNYLRLGYVDGFFVLVGIKLTYIFPKSQDFSLYIVHNAFSYKIVCCMATIFLGFQLIINQTSSSRSLSVFGTFFGVMASLFVSLNAIYTKKVMPHVNDNIWLLTFYNNVNASLLFLPLMAIAGEIGAIRDFDGFSDGVYWTKMILGGVFGFAIGYVTGLQIKVTSPLTHNISGTAKACAQTVIATYWYSEVKSGLWWLSNLIVLGGSAAYTRVRQIEMKKVNTYQDVKA